MEIYGKALNNRTTHETEFGKLHDKSAAVLTIEIIQILIQDNGERQIFVSKINFIDMPGCEVLAQDPETVKMKEGPTLNKGILAVQEVVNELSSHDCELAIYENSQLTRLLRDLFGGNSAGVGIFTLQYDDQIGSGATFKFIKSCQKIANYPITNDNRAIGLVRKYRLDINNLRKILYGTKGETVDQLQLKIADLERRLITENLDVMKFNEEKKGIASKMNEMKEKYNSMVKQVKELQTQLLHSEEEKYSLSKSVIDLQIQNAKLQEDLHSSKYEKDAKALHEEADAVEQQVRGEKLHKTIIDLQDQLNNVLEEKKDIDLELISLRKNHNNLRAELEEQKKKNEQIGLELIQLVHENKTMHKDGNSLSQKHGVVHDEYEKLLKKVTAIEFENNKLKEELVITCSALEQARNDKARAEVIVEQTKLEYENKKVELEKEYINMAKHKDVQIQYARKGEEEGTKSRLMDKELWQNEKIDLHRKYKEAIRKLDVANAETRELKELLEQLKIDKNTVGAQLDELRAAYRTKLGKATGDAAKEELIRTYTLREKESQEEVDTLKARIDKLRAKCKALREYSRNLKFLAEDLIPEDKPKPEILEVEEPQAIKEEKEERVTAAGKKEEMYIAEIERLQEEKARAVKDAEVLKEKVQRLKNKGEKEETGSQAAMIQSKILEELRLLKENPKVVNRPGTANAELDHLRKERNDLLEENRKLKQMGRACLVGGFHKRY